jgi:hypothetical protein
MSCLLGELKISIYYLSLVKKLKKSEYVLVKLLFLVV